MALRGLTAVLGIGLVGGLVWAGTAAAVPPGGGDGPDDGGGSSSCVADADADLSADPATVTVGGSTTLHWTVRAPCSVNTKLVAPNGVATAVSTSGSQSVSLGTVGTQRYRLRLSAFGVTGDAASVDIQVTQPPPPPTSQPPVIIIVRPTYDPLSCAHMVMCALTDVSGDGVEDAVGFIDHSTFNFGWQGRALVRQGSRVTTGGDTTVTFAPWTLWASTGCDTPGEDCQFADLNGDHISDLVEFVKSSVTGSATNPATGATEGDVLTYWADPANHRFGARMTLSGSFCTGSMTCALGDMNGDHTPDAVAFVKSTIGGTQEGDVWVAPVITVGLPPTSAFLLDPQKWSDWMCVQDEVCALGDVNGDGRGDAVAFVRSSRTGAAEGNVWVALGAPGTRVAGALLGATLWASRICVQSEVCGVADVDGDHRDDAIAKSTTDTTIGPRQAQVGLSNGANGFAAARLMDLRPASAGGSRPEQDDGGDDADATCLDKLNNYLAAREKADIVAISWLGLPDKNSEFAMELFEASVDLRVEEEQRLAAVCPL